MQWYVVIRQVIILTLSTRSLDRFILLPLRAFINVMSLSFALVATYVAKIFLGFNLLSLFLQGLHERLLHSLLGLLDSLLHQRIKLTLNWDMVCSFTQEASCNIPTFYNIRKSLKFKTFVFD